MSIYFDFLCEAMSMLAQQPGVLFMGQAVAYPGTGMSRTFKDVPKELLRETPVFEDTQMGIGIGYALSGGLPVLIYPRYNFLLLAMNQLVLHLDKLPVYSRGGYNPKVIIRTAIGASKPLFPGVQHLGNYGEPLRYMLATVTVRELWQPHDILPAYEAAVRNKYSTILVERAEMYG